MTVVDNAKPLIIYAMYSSVVSKPLHIGLRLGIFCVELNFRFFIKSSRIILAIDHFQVFTQISVNEPKYNRSTKHYVSVYARHTKLEA